MPQEKKVKDFMIPLEDYPHIPYWFTLRQAMAIVREASSKFEGSFEPRAVLVFDENYQLIRMLTLRDIIKGLGPRFLKESGLIKADPSLTVMMGDLFGPGLKEASQKPVSEVMSPIRVTAKAEDPLAMMIMENVGMMPAMKDGKVALGLILMAGVWWIIEVMPIGATAIAITLPISLVIAQYLGVAPHVIFFALLANAGMPFNLLIGAAPNAIAYESKQFTTGEFFAYGWIPSIVLMVLLAVFCFIIWPLQGMPVLIK